MLIRINKFLADSGLCSRRKADDLIAEGRVKIGDTIAVSGIKIDPSIDQISVDGKKINKAAEKVYIALYKPRGIVSSKNDELGRETVIDLLPERLKIAHPVGRLDRNSEGLIILTNDGDLTNILTHPSFEHKKTYEVKVRALKQIEPKEIEKRFKAGLSIDHKIMKADKIVASQVDNSNNLILDITLHTGFNRQIRKMCDKIGLEVLKLKRTNISKLDLNKLNLKPGEYKIIDKSQIL